MHKISKYSFIALISVMFAVSCNERIAEMDMVQETHNTAGIAGKANAFGIDESLQGALPSAQGDTKTTLVYAEGKGLNFFWNEDDNVAVFGSLGQSQQIPLFINGVAGQQVKVANFQISKDYALKTGVDYVAYCPILNPSIYLSATVVPFDFTGQTQKDGEATSTEHLGEYDYMVSEPTTPQEDNVAMFNFKHKCSAVLIQFSNVPAGSYKKVTLQAGEDIFVEKGTMDIFKDTVAPSSVSDAVTLTYKKSVTISGNGSLNAWIMVMPVNLTGKKVQLILTPASGKELRYNVKPQQLKDFVAGKAYRISVDASHCIPEGVLPGEFTVDANGTIMCFAKGNLQHQPSTDKWRLAANQYDFIGGTADDEKVYGNVAGSDNTKAGVSGYTGWGDLYKWDNYSNKVETGWHTLTKDQWDYIVKTRTTTTGAHYYMGNLNISDKGVTVFGVFLFPDNWTGTFFPVSPAIGESKNKYDNNNNTWCKGITATVSMTAEQFEQMQDNDGVVFLPETGRLNGSVLQAFKDATSGGAVQAAGHLTIRYWTATESTSSRANAFQTYDGLHIGVMDYNANSGANLCTDKAYGMAIRNVAYVY